MLSGPHGFHYKKSSFVDNPVYITITSLLLLSRFSLPLYSIIILGWILLNLSFLEFLELLGYGESCVLSHLGSFFLLLFLQIFLLPLSLPLLGRLQCMCMLVSHGSPKVFVVFFVVFFLLLRIYNFIWPVNKFADSFSWSHLLNWIHLFFSALNFYLIPYCDLHFFIDNHKNYTEKTQSQKTNQTDHMDHSLV